jgi:methylglutaconyl-CoA hydratase
MRFGLVHQTCEAAALEEILARLCDDLLHGAPGALATLKAATAEFASPKLSAIKDWRPPHEPKTAEAIAEAAEGVASFREKRKPKWYPP